MPERESGEKDPRSKFDRKSAVVISAFMGVFCGGVSYGITSAVSEGDLDRKIGIGVGGSLAALYTGLFLGFDSSKRAEEYAIQGHMGRAMLKALQSGAENVFGFGAGAAIPAYEASGLKGAIIAGATGALVGTSFPFAFSKDIRHIGKAYRDVIIPARDPRNFPGIRVINHEEFNNDDLLAENPPVYRSYTFEDMISFRQEQVNEVISKAPSLSGDFKSPGYLLGKIDETIFVIPEVSHHPDLDQDSEANLSIKLLDLEENHLEVNPYTEPSHLVWIPPTVFDDINEFNEKRWLTWKNGAWKHGVVIFAKRSASRTEEDPSKFSFDDSYYLLDILIDGKPRGRKREDRRKEVKVTGLIPGLGHNRI